MTRQERPETAELPAPPPAAARLDAISDPPQSTLAALGDANDAARDP